MYTNVCVHVCVSVCVCVYVCECMYVYIYPNYLQTLILILNNQIIIKLISFMKVFQQLSYRCCYYKLYVPAA